MLGRSNGSLDRSRTEPVDRGVMRPATIANTAPVALTSLVASNGPARKRWRSGGAMRRRQVERDQRMVEQVLTHAGKGGDHLDAQRSQVVSRADAGPSEDRRAGVGTGSQHHLAGFDHFTVDQPDPDGTTGAHLDSVD